MIASKFGRAKEIQSFQKDCSWQPKWKTYFFSVLTEVMSTVLFCLTSVYNCFKTLFNSTSWKMKKLPDWIIIWLWIRNTLLNRDKRQFMHAGWIKDGSDQAVMLTQTMWMLTKLFRMMLLHQTQNFSTGQLSHPGWGLRFLSGCPGTANAVICFWNMRSCYSCYVFSMGFSPKLCSTEHIHIEKWVDAIQ